MKVDALNWKILEILQINARQSNTEIARKVGISSPAVAERIKKMEDAGILFFEVSPNCYRLVTHYGIDESDIEFTISMFKKNLS